MSGGAKNCITLTDDVHRKRRPRWSGSGAKDRGSRAFQRLLCTSKARCRAMVPPLAPSAQQAAQQRVFVLRLSTAEPDPLPTLRALLKLALRRFGLRCASVVE